MASSRAQLTTLGPKGTRRDHIIRLHRLASWQMSAPEEYETEAGLGYRGVREPDADWRAPGPAGYRTARTGSSGPSAARPPRWGSLPARRGVVVVFSAAAVGAIGTLVLGIDPGVLLGVLVIVGSVAAAFGVHFRQGYLLIPVPALAYAVGASVAGMFHDRGVDISHTALAVSAAQWFAGGFLWMTAATISVIAITVLRWLAGRQPDRESSRSRPARSASGVSAGRSGHRR
jgi:hypothetical protein